MSRRGNGLAALLVLASHVAPCGALGPHEVALLVNARSPRSVAVANHYADLRGIPESHVVYLELPDGVLDPKARISPADFTRCIWKPAGLALEERGLSDQVLAWVYSVDFPVAVDTRPVLSLQGLTFLRNRVPAEKEAREGLYASPLFTGPREGEEPTPAGSSLDCFRKVLQEEMPLPSMMLGFMGARGNEYAKVVESLRAGARSDGMRPAGTVAFLVSQDIRSRCRHWQFPGTARDLARRGVAARIVEDPKQLPPRLIGLMMGAPWIPPFPSAFQPGAFCDHLTSAAAIFDHYDQAKLTSWIHFGATASAGTVVEPYSLWVKFPAACLYVHYADGATLIESLFLSLRCPLETLLVGEPLAAPWKTAGSVELGPPRADPSGESVSFEVSLRGWERADRYEALLDGRRIAWRVENGRAVVDTRALADGVHTLRLVALSRGPLRQQVFGEAEFTVRRHDRSVALDGLEAGAFVTLHRPLPLRVKVKGHPAEVGILSGTRWLARGVPGRELVLDPARAGEGPVTLRAAALFADGDLVRGPAVRVTIEADAPGENPEQATAGRVQPLTWPADGSEGTFGALKGTAVSFGDAGQTVILETTNPCATAFFRLAGATAITAFEAEMKSSVERARLWRSQRAGLIFNYRNERNFDFWGLLGDRSAWAFGTCRGGVIETVVARGAFIRPEQWHRLAVRQAPDGLEGYLNDSLVCRWEKARINRKLPFGFLAGGEPAQFRNAAIGPP